MAQRIFIAGEHGQVAQAFGHAYKLRGDHVVIVGRSNISVTDQPHLLSRLLNMFSVGCGQTVFRCSHLRFAQLPALSRKVSDEFTVPLCRGHHREVAFEAAITADYDAQSAVERELVLRLASILWRLRRATTMETGLFAIQADHLHDYRENRQLLSDSRDVIHTLLQRANSDRNVKADNTVEFARCFLRLANLPNFALDRLSRYEATLWRQAGRILFALDALDRRKPQERTRCSCVRRPQDLVFERE